MSNFDFNFNFQTPNGQPVLFGAADRPPSARSLAHLNNRAEMYFPGNPNANNGIGLLRTCNSTQKDG
jgi:hypothetical protein